MNGHCGCGSSSECGGLMVFVRLMVLRLAACVRGGPQAQIPATAPAQQITGAE